jgi:hypothetical protein
VRCECVCTPPSNSDTMRKEAPLASSMSEKRSRNQLAPGISTANPIVIPAASRGAATVPESTTYACSVCDRESGAERSSARATSAGFMTDTLRSIRILVRGP